MVKWFVNKDVLLLSFSAFFADLGYQSVLAFLPILFVIILHAPVYILGLLYALQYGVGALFSYLGGIIADKYGAKKTAIIGNSLIPLLSFMGLISSYFVAGALYLSGWWSRDFRSPPRRAMVSEAAEGKYKIKAYGVLHALDLGGGAVSLVYLIIMLALHINYKFIILFTLLPLIISTLLISKSSKGKKVAKKVKKPLAITQNSKVSMSAVLLATSLFGFSYYSLGYPILTIAQKADNNILGVASYLIFLLVSAVTGYYLGSMTKKLNLFKSLSVLGYMFAAFGSLLLGIYYLFALNIVISYLAVAIIGFALGAIETFEPSIISMASNKENVGKGLGLLSSSRSIGLFAGNILMGILYVFSPFYSYTYAFVVSLAAGLIVYFFARGF